MAVFVVDASVSLAWCFEDETTDWTDGLLERLRNGDCIVVPAHWPAEISNGLLMGVRASQVESNASVVTRGADVSNTLRLLALMRFHIASP